MRLAALALALAAPAVAHANTPEDVYGASARTVAQGGAGTALVGDYAATHYNPAGLAHSCLRIWRLGGGGLGCRPVRARGAAPGGGRADPLEVLGYPGTHGG